MAAPKGTRPPNAGKGRKRGVPNKISGDLRAMVLGALDRVGGQAYLEEQARANPQAFLTMVGRCLPKQVNVNANAKLTVRLVGVQRGA